MSEENNINSISILFPGGVENNPKVISEVTMHDLGFDLICKEVATKESEEKLLLKILSKVYSEPVVSQYRLDVFEDILLYPELRNKMQELLDKVNFLKDFGSLKKDYEVASSAFDLMHRLDEINEYIQCVEAIHECLTNIPIKSKGLIDLRLYVDEIYRDNSFSELKKDISELKADTYCLRSVTIGINLNERYECESVGLISVNNKKFYKAPILNNFSDAILRRDTVNDGNDWDGSMKFSPITSDDSIKMMAQERAALCLANPFVAAETLAHIATGDIAEDCTRYLDRLMNHLISSTVKRLREVLSKYVTITIGRITSLIPEFMYYIRFAEYIEKLQNKGFVFSKPEVIENERNHMLAEGVYNLKLVNSVTGFSDIVVNTLDFSNEHLLYFLTGANRGGKTTITQAIGQLFVLAQGGIFIPGASFKFSPVDNIFTHFPADEDKTLDLGRLGEECKRFREIYLESTNKSLILLNETFSTTSFEEGYYIAKDSARAILKKGVRTIYNTHMHKLGFDAEEFNKESELFKACSIIAKTESQGERSFKIYVEKPEGMSFANDIATKYGVTYEKLIHSCDN